MRVTLQTIHQNILFSLNKIVGDMNKINNQISTQQQMSKISDDPVNLVVALGYRTSLAEIKQYQDNLVYGNTMIEASETTLREMKDQIMRAKTLALQLANSPMTPENRLNAATEVRQLFEESVLLANTQVNGKYVFAGYRTTGYDEVEPTPFIIDALDGYRVNGSQMAPMENLLTGTLDNAAPVDLVADDLLVNGVDVGAVTLNSPAATDYGLNMEGSWNLRTAVNAAPYAAATPPATPVNASLTTLHSSGLAANIGAGPFPTGVFFYLNDVPVAFGTSGANPTVVANDTVAAINAVSDLTGVIAERGDGTNGGIADSVVLKNMMIGDESDIVITDYNEWGGTAQTNLTGGAVNLTKSVGLNSNTGQISLSSSESFELTSNNFNDDTILNRIGLGGGNLGFADEFDDGELIFGSRIATGDLKVNGTEVTTAADSISDVYENISAVAKADAINNNTAQLGVTAEVVPASLLASGAVNAGNEDVKLTGVVQNNNVIANGDLLINGNALGAINTSFVDPVSGLNMERAAFFKYAVNGQSASTGVRASLTTLYAGAVTNTAPFPTTVSFKLNGVSINVNANGSTEQEVAEKVRDAINAVSDQTGVTSLRGDGTNGGVVDSIVLYNTLPGDESPIDIADLDATEAARTGMTNGAKKVGDIGLLGGNTGKITFSSDSPFTLFTPTPPGDDSILDELGLGGGETDTGVAGDVADDGILEYGSTPVYLGPGDLKINGVDIFELTTAVTGQDTDNATINAINAKQSQTGVTAGRNGAGMLILSAVDGRNLHIETSDKGEEVTQLNGTTAQSQDKLYFGSVRLLSGNKFRLESDISPIDSIETGFAALGLTGGEASTGEKGDIAGDGKIFVDTVFYEDGYVRYVGDRNNDIALKVSKRSTLDVSKNGMDAVFDTGVFSALKNFEDYLRGQNYRSITGTFMASDTSVTLDSGETGLEFEDDEEAISAGSFTINVTSHDMSPPQQHVSMAIAVDPGKDTLEDVAERINAVPGIKAYWDAGYLHIESRDPDRYTFDLSNDTSNFLKAAGARPEDMQVHNIGDSIAEFDTLLDSLTEQIADFGARANRIMVQEKIYTQLDLAASENLSERQDTDIMKALMEIKAKETAYQAALSAASRTMQLSLVDYL